MAEFDNFKLNYSIIDEDFIIKLKLPIITKKFDNNKHTFGDVNKHLTLNVHKKPKLIFKDIFFSKIDTQKDKENVYLKKDNTLLNQNFNLIENKNIINEIQNKITNIEEKIENKIENKNTIENNILNHLNESNIATFEEIELLQQNYNNQITNNNSEIYNIVNNINTKIDQINNNFKTEIKQEITKIKKHFEEFLNS